MGILGWSTLQTRPKIHFLSAAFILLRCKWSGGNVVSRRARTSRQPTLEIVQCVEQITMMDSSRQIE